MAIKKNDFKSIKDKFSTSAKYKPQRFFDLGPDFLDAVGLPGPAVGHLNMLLGHSDTGKTTALVKTAVDAQKKGILPVFIITEQKWSFEHAKLMGFDCNEVVDEETGELDWDGFYIFNNNFNYIEQITDYINNLLDEQEKGNLDYSLLFLWDSVGSIPCEMSVKQGNNNPMWNAGAMATQFGNFINQQFPLSRKEKYPYTNTFFVINKTGVQPALTPMSQPRMTNKGGDTFYYDVSLCLTFGNVTNAGTSKINAVKDKKKVEFSLRTKIACDKNHINGITTMGTIISTVHGFIKDDPNAVKKYKDAHAKEWADILGQGNYSVQEDTSEWDEKVATPDLFETED